MKDFKILQFSRLSTSDIVDLGIDIRNSYSSYNIKATNDYGVILGYIIVEKNAKGLLNCIIAPNNIIDGIKGNTWFKIKRIYLNKMYINTGNLENMFDYLLSILPKDCYLWSNCYWDRKSHYLERLGFYDFLIYTKYISNIKIFSIYHLNFE